MAFHDIVTHLLFTSGISEVLHLDDPVSSAKDPPKLL
jgi:hypothetical protein